MHDPQITRRDISDQTETEEQPIGPGDLEIEFILEDDDDENGTEPN